MNYSALSTTNHPAQHQDIENLSEALAISKKQRTNLPVILELTGMPKAGKTTAISRVKRGLSQLGIKTLVIDEAATVRVAPSLKSDLFLFNTQCLLINIQEMLLTLSYSNTYDVVIFDRGLYDSKIWLSFLAKTGLASASIVETLCKICDFPTWHFQTDHVYFLDCDWDTYSKRYQDDTPFEGNPKLSPEYFSVLREAYHDSLSNTEKHTQLPNSSFDCSNQASQSPAGATHQIAIKIIRDAVDTIVSKSIETIAVISSSHYNGEKNITLTSSETQSLILDMFGRDASGKRTSKQSIGPTIEWVNRDTAEASSEYLQIISSAYFTKDGKYLTLRRSKKEKRDELKGKLTLIVGGHVDEIDQKDIRGGANEVENCLRREIQEELAYVDMPSIRPRFALRLGSSPMGLRHLSFVHEVETYSEAIQPIQIPGAGDYEPNPEFNDLNWLINNKECFDDWSKAIIDHLATDSA